MFTADTGRSRTARRGRNCGRISWPGRTRGSKLIDVLPPPSNQGRVVARALRGSRREVFGGLRPGRRFRGGDRYPVGISGAWSRQGGLSGQRTNEQVTSWGVDSGAVVIASSAAPVTICNQPPPSMQSGNRQSISRLDRQAGASVPRRRLEHVLANLRLGRGPGADKIPAARLQPPHAGQTPTFLSFPNP